MIDCIVVGIGGAGGNMINAIIKEGLHHVSYIALNTDYQALKNVSIDTKIILGETLTAGMGTGASPEIGKLATSLSNESSIPKYTGVEVISFVSSTSELEKSLTCLLLSFARSSLALIV